jgi:propanol-preferring alcohol dehydrogenase
MARRAPSGPMRAMVLHAPAPAAGHPLHLEERAVPTPRGHEVLVRVERCGVCRTDLHVVEGDLPPLRPAVVPGHEVVGRVAAVGPEVTTLSEGASVGLPWLRSTCGRCEYCTTGRENLCAAKQYTGYGADGGYAEYALGEEGFVLPLPPGDPARLAPLLCAGIIGYRAFRAAEPRPGGRIGFFGFGGSAHLTLQLAAKLGFETVAYSRNPAHLALARRLGASETVLTSEPRAPRGPTLDGAILFAPVGAAVLEALPELQKGGTLAIAAIHLTPIPPIDYRLLFGERAVRSVEANTRADAKEFLALAVRLGLESEVTERPLEAANEALADLAAGRVTGAVVLDCTAR